MYDVVATIVASSHSARSRETWMPEKEDRYYERFATPLPQISPVIRRIAGGLAKPMAGEGARRLFLENRLQRQQNCGCASAQRQQT